MSITKGFDGCYVIAPMPCADSSYVHLGIHIYDPDNLAHLRLQLHMSSEYRAHIDIFHSRLFDRAETSRVDPAVECRDS
jgi:hypothetical protein